MSRRLAPHFTRAQARSFVNRRIRLRRKYAGVPRGTTGVVTAAKPWPARPAEYDLVVTYHLPARSFCGRTRAFTDFFTRDDFEQFAELAATAGAQAKEQAV